MTWKIESSEQVVEQYCIYWNPSDYPKKFVVRRWTISRDGNIAPDAECRTFTRLTGARRAVPKGLVRIGRDSLDDVSIVEVWI